MAAADVVADQSEGGDGPKFLEYSGPQKGVKYPVRVPYCGECSMPVEYCEYYPNYEKCKEWLKANLPNDFSRLMADKDEEDSKCGDDDGERKKRQTRGGKGMMKAKKKTEPQGIKMWTATRGKRKKVTFVTGLASYEIDLKDASKYFATKFSCGSSVTADDEVVIQGDVKDDLWDILPEKWKQIDEDDIDDKGDKK